MRFHFLARSCLVLLASLPSGCGHAPQAIDYDLEAFANGIEAILEAGMPLKEARRELRERFPPPRENTEGAPLVSSVGSPGRNRRFNLVWSTTTPGVSLVLTLECDRQLRVARWSTGPLFAR